MKRIKPLEMEMPKRLGIVDRVLSLVFGGGQFIPDSPVATPEETHWVGKTGAFEEPGFIGTEEISFEDSGIERSTGDGVFGWRREDDEESVAW